MTRATAEDRTAGLGQAIPNVASWLVGFPSHGISGEVTRGCYAGVASVRACNTSATQDDRRDGSPGHARCSGAALHPVSPHATGIGDRSNHRTTQTVLADGMGKLLLEEEVDMDETERGRSVQTRHESACRAVAASSKEIEA